jgi:4-alpha-glucanotransferase
MGDLPIYVAHDSADVWTHPQYFRLDEHGDPIVVAGVPPDYFSATSQLSGNPIYDWDALARDGYRWWIDRIRATLGTVDMIRLDHFRGFEGYWEVPAGEPTAERPMGQGPGAALFETATQALGGCRWWPNLGVITPEGAIRERFGLPGMSSHCNSRSAATRRRPHSVHTTTRAIWWRTPGRTIATRPWDGGPVTARARARAALKRSSASGSVAAGI